MPSAQVRGVAQRGGDEQWMDCSGALAWLRDESLLPGPGQAGLSQCRLSQT